MRISKGLMSRSTWIIAVTAILMFAGCVKNETVVKINKDGSGYVIVTKLFSREVADMIASQMQQMGPRMARMSGGNSKEQVKDPFYDEKTIKKSARTYGPTVKFVKAKKINMAGSKGYVAVYSFKDINDVFIAMKDLFSNPMNMYETYSMNSGDDEEDTAEVERGENIIEFKMAKDTANKIQVFMPAMSDNDEFGMSSMDDGDDEDEAEKKEGEEDERESYIEDSMGSYMMRGGYGMSRMPSTLVGVSNEKEAAKRLLKGMRVAVTVEFAGDILKTTSSHQDQADKKRIQLIEIDGDKLSSTPKGVKKMEKMSRYMYGSPSRMMALLKEVPGALMETNREITVELK